jgi:hypothetical protein
MCLNGVDSDKATFNQVQIPAWWKNTLEVLVTFIDPK